MDEKGCLDTDFIVYFLRNREKEVRYVTTNEDRTLFATTIINLFELYYGAYKSGVHENVIKP